MKMTITTQGDKTVGIFPELYEIECPFDEDADRETREDFRSAIQAIYSEFCDDVCKGVYDNEDYEFYPDYTHYASE